MRPFSLPCLVSALALATVGPAFGGDWSQWRGPERNGLGPKSPALGNSLAGLTPLWLAKGIPSGDEGGRGGLVVHEGKVYGLVKAGADEEVFCLDAAIGKSLWNTPLHEPGGQPGSSTPCIVLGKLFVAGSSDQEHCLNAETGSILWNAKLPRTHHEPIASSIAVVGHVAVLLADALTALDTNSGQVLWTQPEIKGFESSPTTWSVAGHDYVICNTDRETHCVNAADGHIMWSVPGGGKSTPVVSEEYGGDFLVNMSENRKAGLSTYRLNEKAPQKLWTMDITDRGSSPVVYDGHVYAVAGGSNGHSAHLLSIHLDTGKVAWNEIIDFAEVSSPVIVDDKMFVVCGTMLALVQAKIGRASCRERV